MPLSKPSEVLQMEHDVIRHLLNAMDGMAERLEAGRDVPRKDVDSALEVVVEFADKCHHAKEEKVLFPALRDHGSTEALRVVLELEGDHQAGRKLVGAMRSEATAGESSDAAARHELARDARLYTKLLRTHIDHETERLLPLADALPAIVRDRIASDFDRIEREETGAGVHERYESVVHDLHTRYSPKGSSAPMHSHHH